MGIINNKLTNSGKRIKTNGMLSEDNNIRFTKISIGEGIASSNWEEFETLISPICDINIDVKLYDYNAVKVRGIFNNKEITRDFFYREIGLFAIDQESGKEVLFCYGNAGDFAEKIIAYNSEQAVIEKMIDLIIKVDNAEKVVIELSNELYATKDELEYLTADYKASLKSTQWMGETVPYYQSVRVEGIKETDNPIIGMLPSEITTDAIKQEKSWSCINRIVTKQDEIIAYCYKKKPSENLNIQIKVVR